MKLFGRTETPVEAASAAVERARGRHEGLIVQLRDAERELASLKSAAVASALAHGRLDDDTSADVAAGTASVETLNVVVVRAAMDVQEAQAALVHEQDQAQRAKSIEEIERLRADMAEPCEQLLSAIRTLVPLMKRGADFALDAKTSCRSDRAAINRTAGGI
jgi:hypothetical protein